MGVRRGGAQELWYTYDEMNRVLVTQGVFSNNVIGISAGQGTELAYNLKGERTSARTGGEHLTLQHIVFEENIVLTGYGKTNGLFREHYGYDGLGRLIWTEQETPTTTYDWVTQEQIGTSITSVRTNTRQYDRASRETLDQTFAADNQRLSMTARTTTYEAQQQHGTPTISGQGKAGKKATTDDELGHPPISNTIP